MKFTTQLFVAATAFCVMACSQENNNTTTETASADDLTVSASAPDTANPLTSAADPNQPQITVDAPQPSNQPVAAGLNPPHGQPGHDCAVPVGSPLNGAANAAPQTNPTITTTPTPQPSTNPNINTSPVFNAPASQPVAAGLNPPHGQPGHDCAVPVGSPLKK